MAIIVRNVLTSQELTILQEECDLYSKVYHNDTHAPGDDEIATNVYLDKSCAIDLFENISLNDEDSARTNENEYFSIRWNDPRLIHESKRRITSESRLGIQNILLKKLPNILNYFIHSSSLYLFNEHYVVKPSNSQIIFRWHRDIDEQLQSCCTMSTAKYYSLWCPLDTVTEENGTLIIPSGVPIYEYSYEELDGRKVNESPPIHPDELFPIDSCHDDNSDDSNHPLLNNGQPLLISAGSIVIFSSHLLHCSGPNTTSQPRRVFYSQYSETIISSHPSRSTPLCFAIPCHLSPLNHKRKLSIEEKSEETVSKKVSEEGTGFIRN